MVIIMASIWLWTLPGLVSLRRRYLLKRGRNYRRENIWPTSWKRKWFGNNSNCNILIYVLYRFTAVIKHMASFYTASLSLIIHCNTEQWVVFFPQRNSSRSSFHRCLQRKKVHLLLYFRCAGLHSQESTEVFCWTVSPVWPGKFRKLMQTEKHTDQSGKCY